MKKISLHFNPHRRIRGRLHYTASYLAFIVPKGSMKAVRKPMRWLNAKRVKGWEDSLERFRLMEKLGYPLTENEKKKELRGMREGTPKQHCFEHEGNIDILAYCVGRLPMSDPRYHINWLSRVLQTPMVGTALKIHRSRRKEYNDLFRFLICAVDGDEELTEGRREKNVFTMPDLDVINRILGTDITPDEYTRVCKIERASEFVPQMEKLLHSRIRFSEEMLANEFICLEETMWYGIYQERSPESV